MPFEEVYAVKLNGGGHSKISCKSTNDLVFLLTYPYLVGNELGYCNNPTLHPIWSCLGLQWRTHSFPPTRPSFASLLGLRPQEKALIVLS